jgi:tRNA uridine 5-carboxymethylaminomethyl modification enzyme
MFVYPKRYDVIVVGGGHAGVEAALAVAKMGCKTLLLTMNLDTIGQMSCNPAVGGLAKGHLVREIDALGGEIGKNADMTGLQFRMLNMSKGTSVRAPRAQCDKKAYQLRLKWICERRADLDCKQGQTVKLLVRHDEAYGVETTFGIQYHGTAVVVTTGTFLRGLMHIGPSQQEGGRSGEPASAGLSASLKAIGLELGRLKTGTPPRILRRTIDFSKTEVQAGDEPVPFFSFWKEDLFHVEHDESGPSTLRPKTSEYPPGSILCLNGGQSNCFVTYTTKATAEIIRANLHKSPMYSGAIEGIGPRYCPSIEDKVVKFPEKERQQIFLEPEGIATEEVYVNGFSTCLPFETQVELVRTIIGCERAEIMRPAYAVEYDFVFPTQLCTSLESKTCRNLFLAGQINGTSGYEEAAAQGIMAGINAARRVQGREPIVLRRDQAYIGVLIDDLVTKGTSEPYRMFTSRAEHRLVLRHDNADLRLSPLGYELGLLPCSYYQKVQSKREKIDAEIKRLQTTRVDGHLLVQILRRPGVRYLDLSGCDRSLDQSVIEQVETEVKYAGYIARQRSEIEKQEVLDGKLIPPWFDYSSLRGLRTEARLKLAKVRPSTIGQAARVSGVSPADIGLILVAMKCGPQDSCDHESREHREPY